jgi:hypothetical protein
MRNGCLVDPNSFESALHFLYYDIKQLQKSSQLFLQIRHAADQYSTPRGPLKEMTPALDFSNMDVDSHLTERPLYVSLD